MNAFKTFLNLDISEIIIADIEEFTCHMYDNPKNKCLNDVLKANFDKKKCNPKPGKSSLDLIKSVVSTKIPPCSKELLQQTKRTCYVAHLYSAAYDVYPAFDLFPFEYSYKLSENGESLTMHEFGNEFRFLVKF